VTLSRILPHALGLFALCGTLGRDLFAQDKTVSVGVARILSAGEGVASSCFEGGSRGTITGRVAAPLLSSRISVALTGRTPALSSPARCVSAPLNPNGTFVFEERVNLLAAHFLATDVRVGVSVGPPVAIARISLGGGTTWRTGDDFPYVLGATQLTFRPTPRLEISLEGEYDRFRVVSNPVRFTYRDGLRVSEEHLGRSHVWSRATFIGLFVGVRW
jgi:hypothetical protein